MEFGSEYVYQPTPGDDEDDYETIHEIKEPSPAEHHGTMRIVNLPSYTQDNEVQLECEGMDFDPDDETIGEPEPIIRERKIRLPSTNTLLFQFNKLESDSRPPEETLLPSDAVICRNNDCRAYLSCIDSLDDSASGKQIWKCKFCGTDNYLEMTVKLPQKGDVIYQNPSSATSSPPEAPVPSVENEPCYIFVIDTSSSMGASFKIKTHEPLNEELKKLLEIQATHLQAMKMAYGGNQYVPGLGPNEQYITRLMGVQTAVMQYIKDLKREQPKLRVGIISFNSKVIVIGDGCNEPHFISTPNELDNLNHLTTVGKNMPQLRPLSESSESLHYGIMNMTEKGQTALGPAMVVALNMAKNAGSKIFLCTDGMANVGLGNLEGDTESRKQAEKFYTDLGGIAKDKGIMVSVLTLEGTECELRSLRNMVENTAGDVNVVNHKHLSGQFKALANLMATNTKATFVVSSKMYISDKDNKDNLSWSSHTTDVGNISDVSKITFTYGFKPVTQDSDPDKASSSASATDPMDVDNQQSRGSATPTTTVQARHDHSSEALPDVSKCTDPDPILGPFTLSCGHSLGIPPPRPKKEEYWPEEKLPFQIQVEYTDLNNVTKTRVWTDERLSTRDKNKARETTTTEPLQIAAYQVVGDALLSGDKQKAIDVLLGVIEKIKNVAEPKVVTDLQKTVDDLKAPDKKIDQITSYGHHFKAGSLPSVIGVVPTAPQQAGQSVLSEPVAVPLFIAGGSQMDQQVIQLKEKQCQARDSILAFKERVKGVLGTPLVKDLDQILDMLTPSQSISGSQAGSGSPMAPLGLSTGFQPMETADELRQIQKGAGDKLSTLIEQMKSYVNPDMLQELIKTHNSLKFL